MTAGDPIAGLLADLQTITETARAGVISRHDEVLEPGETRPAAILFVDIVGFTPLARSLSSEVLTKVIDRSFRIFELTVRAHGGYCDKVMGDAALYVFAGHPNYPPVCEAALRAALKLQDRLAQVNESLGETTVRLAIRQGVAFGEVTRQAVGAQRAQLTVMGDTVNRAQRLQATAQPNTIQTTGRVLEKAGDTFARQQLGKVDLKGIGAVTAYRVTGVDRPPVQLRGAFRHLSPLTGREAELHQALAQIKTWLATGYPPEPLEPAQAGNPQAARNRLLLLRGVPAVGKSRLAYEIAGQAEAELGAAVATAHCAENTPLAQLTAELARVAGLTAENLPQRWEDLCAMSDQEEALGSAGRRQHLRLLAYILGCKAIDARAVGRADPKSFALSCQLAIRACCELVALEGRPVLLIIEDLQWLGGFREVLAGVMARACLAQPLIVIGTARPEYEHEPGSLGEGGGHTIELGQLSRGQGDALVGALLPGLALPAAVANELHEKAEGIPYFYEDFVRMLVRQGLVEERQGGWALTRELLELDVPDDLETLMLGRLDQLDNEVREVARRASVLGRSFARDLLAAIERRLGFTAEGHPDDDLRAMLAERLLAVEMGDRYFFEHALLRQAAYGSLLRTNRTMLHRLAAEVLAGLYVPGGAGELELLAQLVDHLEASGQYTSAHERACALLLILAGILKFDNWDDWEARARHLWEKAGGAGLAAGGPGASASAPLLRALARRHWCQGRLPKALELYEQSLQIERRTGDEHGAAQSLMGIGNVFKSRGDYERAMELYGQSLEIKRRVGDELGAAQTLNNMAVVHNLRGEYDKALDVYGQSLEGKRRVGDEHGAAQTLMGMANVYKSRGDYGLAMELYGQSLEVKRRMGDEHGAAQTLHNMGTVYYFRGEYDQALSLYGQSLEVGRRVGDEHGTAQTLNNIGAVYESRGEYDRALELYDQSLEAERRVGDEHSAARTLGNMGNIYNLRGEYDRALELYEQSLEVQRRVGDEPGAAKMLESIANVYSVRGESGRALELYGMSLEVLRRAGDEHSVARALVDIGRAYLATGDYEKVRSALSESQAGLEKAGAKYDLAWLHQSWAGYWLALHVKQAGEAGPESGSAGSRPDAGPATPAGTLAKVLEHLRIASGLLAEIGASLETRISQEIAKARAALIDFAREHGLEADVAGLIADHEREQAELSRLRLAKGSTATS